jgi:hypothetical protein
MFYAAMTICWECICNASIFTIEIEILPVTFLSSGFNKKQLPYKVEPKIV